MDRRSFIRGTCRICLLGPAAVAITTDFASCSPAAGNHAFKPVIKNNMVEVPLTLFDNKPLQIISPEKYSFEIAVEKKADNTYNALLLKCTHYQNQLTVTGNGYTCSAHGSKFDKEGKVLKGPAAEPLQYLQTHITKNNLLITL